MNGKFFLRLIQKNTFYYLITVVGLTAGVTAFFFIVSYIGYEFSYDDAQLNGSRIYRVVSSSSRTPVPMAPTLRNEIAGVQNASRVIFSVSGSKFIARTNDGELFEEDGYYVDSTFFDLFTYEFIDSSPAKPLSRPDQLVITEEMAARYFGDQEAVGKTIEFTNTHLRQKVYTVAGVIRQPQRNSQFDFDFLIPFEQYGSTYSESWTINLVYTYLLLDPGADLVAVSDLVRAVVVEREKLNDAEASEVRLQPFTDLHFDSTTTFDHGSKNRIENLWILSSIAVLILVIAGINFVNLSTARASDRIKEVGMKKVLGASRRSLVFQFIAEAVTIAFLSCILATMMIVSLKTGFETLTGVSLTEGWRSLDNYRFLLPLFPVLIGLLAGIYPAFVISATIPLQSLKGAQSGSRSPLRTALVVVQFAITTFLIIGTGVIVGQMNYMQNKDLGFNDDLALILNVGGPGIGTRLDVASKLFSQNPNVVSTSGTLTLPGDNTYTMPYSISNSVSGDDGEDNLAGFYVDHDFVKNMGIEVIEGRTFSKALSTDTLNFLLNEAAVKKLRARYGTEWDNPIGQTLNYFRSNNTGWYIAKKGQVIGVVKDFNFASLHHAIEPIAIQVDYNLMYKMIVKIKPDNIAETISFLESKWKELDIIRPFNYQFLDERLAGLYERESKFRSMFSIFAVLSIVISCIGLYGLVLYTTEKRSREMSIRKVLGAGSYHLAMLIGSSFFKPVVIAFVIACPLAWYSMDQWLNQFAFKDGVGMLLFIEAGLLCALLAITTILSRVWKVSRANPVKYLKEN